MDLYLVRHGQSLANAGLTNELDSALTPLGEQQAESTAARLQIEQLTRVYVSPLLRTLQTAAPTCNATGLPAELYADVCEFFSVRHPEYLEFQGLDPDQISVLFPFVTLTNDFPCLERWWPQVLEEYHHVYDRAVNVRNILLERFGATDEKILIVSHAETLGRLTEAFLRVPPNAEGAPWSDNCGISRLYCTADTNAPAELMYLNDTTHLTEKTTSKMVTTRLDKALVDRDLAHGRNEARDLIDAGLVLVDGIAARKPSQLIDSAMELQVSGSVSPYVSRGGQKLAAALAEFGTDPTGRICLDVGASTGGFTDCLLQRGATHVTAIDVGHGQMVPHIASDPRVETREGINARHITLSDFPTLFDLIVVDLSFISLTLVLPALAPLLAPQGDIICLVKPQFEVGVNGIGKGGIVRSEVLRGQALERVIASAKDIGLLEHGRMVSPITGGEGNKEFLVWVKHLEQNAGTPVGDGE